MKKGDLVGKRFGLLTVIREATKEDAETYHKTYSKDHTMWLCRCDCGNYTVRSSGNFSTHSSCGCYPIMVNKRKYESHIGERYGRLVVDSAQIIGKRVFLKCICDCGNDCLVTLYDLTSGHIKSCGCYSKEYHEALFGDLQRKDLTGKRFGRLTALYITGHRSLDGRLMWKCICDCGNYHDVSSAALLSGGTQSCGCVKSRGELKIMKLLTDGGLSFKQQYWFNDLRSESGNPYYFDFGILNSHGDLEYLIEYDGIHHFNATGCLWLDENAHRRTVMSDHIKNQYCSSKQLPLIRIPYTRFNDLCLDDLLLPSTDFLCVG